LPGALDATGRWPLSAADVRTLAFGNQA